MTGLVEQLRASDGDMARVLEDLIVALDHRGLLPADALPESAVTKLEQRAELRKQLRALRKKGRL